MDDIQDQKYIHYMPFVVDETPRCMWDWDIAQHNRDFINSIDPTYFQHLADVHAGLLEGDQKQYAATTLRAGYSQGLETLFALLCALVQAPSCMIGWVLQYRHEDLFSVTRKIHNHQPVLSKLSLSPVTWDTLAAMIHHLPEEDKEHQWVPGAFGRLWHGLAADFLNEQMSAEYNSIKHGLRLHMGGFYFALGLEETPGVPAPPENMRVMDNSVFGSSFYVTEKLHDARNFRVKRMSRNWKPEKYVYALQLIASSIANILAFLKVQGGADPSEVKLTCPAEESMFEEPWKYRSAWESFNMNSIIRPEHIKPLTKEEILAEYKS